MYKEKESRERGVEHRIVNIRDKGYPKKLKRLCDAPISLYVKGALPDPAKKTVAVVGARRCSVYGSKTARSLARKLAKHGVQIISGLAYGIDAAAHEGCIEGGGNTFGVLGCGIDIVYPPSNAPLYEKLLSSGGGIISEFDPGTPPLPYRFPIRNRIISALSDAVVIVEAKKRSGSLITASYALEQGVPVYAVPGRLGDRNSEGTNELLWQGASPALSAEHILADLGIDVKKEKPIYEDDGDAPYKKDEERILELLSFETLSLDEICRASQLDVRYVSRLLLLLELKGCIFSPTPGSYTGTDR